MKLHRWMLSFHATCDLCGAEIYADNSNHLAEQVAEHEADCK